MRTVLLDYSIAKKKEPKYEFHYNYEKGLNVVNRNSMEMPFIDSPDKMVCLMSKTEAARDDKTNYERQKREIEGRYNRR